MHIETIKYTHYKPRHESADVCSCGSEKKLEYRQGVHRPPPLEETPSRQPRNNGSGDCDQTSHCGLLHFRNWWERVKVDISVQGELISGVPIFIEENTIRVINDGYSYFIPLVKVDYIRTADGLRSIANPPHDTLPENNM